MAEYGAHMTTTLQDKPSIFDVIAQESLLESFEPAFKHVLRVLAEKNPSRYSYLLIYADEIYLCFHSLLQYHYLTNYGASFAENFYDLKRVPLDPKLEKPERLTLKSEIIVRSLVALVGVPYVRQSLTKYFLALQEEKDSGTLEGGGTKKALKSAFLRVWPVVHLFYQVLTVYYYLRFLSGRHKAHSPLLDLVGVYLTSLTEEDAGHIEEKSAKLMYNNIRSPRHLGQWVIGWIGWCLQNSLEVGAFFLQFLEWFYSSSSRTTLFAPETIPPPPHSSVTSVVDSTVCPICLQERKQATVLAVSGYVFCYSCILLYVRQHGTCPVTRYPARTSQLIRIYKD